MFSRDFFRRRAANQSARIVLFVAGALVLAPAAMGGCAHTPEANEMKGSSDAIERRNRDLVERAFAAWADGTGTPYELLADEVQWTIVGHSDASRTYASRAAFIGEVIEPFGARMSQGLRPTIRQLTTDGDTVIIFFDAAGVAKDGRPYTNTYAWFWEMRDGRVVRAHAFFDSIAFNDLWRRVSP